MNLYAGKQVLVTGGLGFIGSNLAIRLVRSGAKVTIVDSCAAGCGAHIRNIDPIVDEVNVIATDIRDVRTIGKSIRRVEIVFNLAGEVSHTLSMEHPERDLELNTRSQLAFLDTCTREARGARVVFAGTRQIYGKPQYLPVDESHPVSPVDVNGVNKHAAELYHLVFSSAGFLDAVVLRFTNVYGPRLALHLRSQGVLPTFFGRILAGDPIEIYGDGKQIRDPLYVDDAVDALLTAGAATSFQSRVFNVGGPQPISLNEMARILCMLSGGSEPVLRPFPPDRSRIDIGDFVSDSQRIGRELGWRPVTSFQDGAAATLEFYGRTPFPALRARGAAAVSCCSVFPQQ